MQHFTFTLFNGETEAQQRHEELPSLQAAGGRAFAMLGEMVGSDDHSWGLQEWRVDVGDPDGLILVTIGAYARDAAALKARARG